MFAIISTRISARLKQPRNNPIFSRSLKLLFNDDNRGFVDKTRKRKIGALAYAEKDKDCDDLHFQAQSDVTLVN